MSGSKTQRHCDVCDETVYNLSEMTEDEAQALLEADQNRCIVLYRRKKDGVILTADTSTPPALSQPSRLAVASVAVAFGAAVAATAVVSVVEEPLAQHGDEVEVACGMMKISPPLRAKRPKNRRRMRLRERRARAQQERGAEGDAKKAKVTPRRHHSRKPTPRELLRNGSKTERGARSRLRRREVVPKKNDKP